MSIHETHGLVVASFSPTSGYHRREGVPAIHLPSHEHGLSTLTNGDWELFPNLETAREAMYHPCQICFPGVEDLLPQ